MGFCVCPPKEAVQKAAKAKRPKWKDTRTDKRLSALHANMSKAVTLDLVKGVKRFKKRMPPDEVIYQAWLKGSFSSISETIPWDKMYEDLEPARIKGKETLTSSIGIGIDGLPQQTKENLRFDYSNPRIERISQQRTGEWIVQPMVEGGRQSIQEIVHRQFTNGLNPRDLAPQIKNSVGLYPRLFNAHMNYVNGLADQGFSDSKIEELGGKYYDRLLNYRAQMIARTETQFMINRGQLEVWKQGQESGLIPNTAVKVWVADGNPCEDCADMDGEEVGINEPWVTGDGDIVDVPTEIHPHCNCIMSIDYKEGEEDAQETDQEQPDEDEE